jgi:hypothetical protein
MECYDQDVRREKDVMAYEGASASVGAPRTIQLAHGTPQDCRLRFALADYVSLTMVCHGLTMP